MEATVAHQEDAVFRDEQSHLQDHKDLVHVLQADADAYFKASLARLSDDLRCQLASFLPVSDVLSLVTVNRDFHYNFGGSSCLWRMLRSRDGGKDLVEASSGSNALDLISVNAAEMKRACLTHAYLTCLPSVRWRQLKRFARANVPSSREGHVMCILGPLSNRMLVLNGGFTGDNGIHLLPLNPSNESDGKWFSIRPSGRPPSFVYGASLTAIDSRRAVRFGGFRGGGYSGETSEVCLLTLQEKGGDLKEMEARWQRISDRGIRPCGRAYHSATLIQNRYLLIVGGMTAVGCLLMEAVLDVETWRWLPTSVSVRRAMPKPSERHGHSIVLDEERNRLVLFGGASGSDLLHSGNDNSEVWELKMGDGWNTDFVSSFPWKWFKIHSDADETENDYGEEAHLSRKERLCLGRCHISGKVSTNTVLLAFGSGRPSTNGLLAYDLRKDAFHRPQVSGRLPTPRFSAAGAIFDGWIVVHGGYSVTNYYGTLGDVAVLDLAPGLKRTFAALPTTTPWLQKAITVLKSADYGIKSSADGQSLSLLRRVLQSVLKAWARMSRKALILVRKERRRLETSEHE